MITTDLNYQINTLRPKMSAAAHFIPPSRPMTNIYTGGEFHVSGITPDHALCANMGETDLGL
ncbi:hypothetical protein Hgul01_05047 [Herpetosiphon gulosus]|uniref:Uncharacterized protein n=1 Tax=Herpetosiphon gulosus TaxID=1973496 RepID=A0ABP9X753_9CHLR